MYKPVLYALSLKQPWAALLVHGLKTVEIRKWPTTRRGTILIHAAKVRDERNEAWKLVPKELEKTAHLLGGIVGSAKLHACLAYRSPKIFEQDQPRHLNLPEWFEGPILYGFVFNQPTPLPFRACSGWMRFFPVDDPIYLDQLAEKC